MLEHTEIGELYEPFSEGKVGSSTMPHKRNPSSCEAVMGATRALKYNVTLMLESMVIEHERDGAAWRAEWRALPESCLMAGGMLAIDEIRASAGLEVDADGMREQSRPARRLSAVRARDVRAVGKSRQADRA